MTNSQQGATIAGAGEGPVVGVVGDLYRFLAVGEQTGGKYAMWEAVVPPGGGPPPHVHAREDESFYVIEGEITFTVDGTTHVAGPGGFAHLPIGSKHAFRNNGTATARMIISVFPAGLERMFFETGVPMEAGATSVPPPSKEEIERLLAAAPRYGVTIDVPPH
ncbi:MAG: cupin domain-containing protein [Planctomycetes bacterium]|nr:cupin domain-containing protein [Planctomycetota bacterium]